jgi:type II secretory pathway component PulF
MKFVVEAYDKGGARQIETVEAASANEARDRAARRGVFVTEVREAGSAAATVAAPGRASKSGTPKRHAKTLALIARELSVLVSTGTPVVEALTALERQITEPTWNVVLRDVRRRVEEGEQFAAALAHHPGAFDAVSRSLIAAGESSGQLDAMLARLATITRRQAQTRSIVMGAMMYPTLLIGVAVGVLGLMLMFVLPRFSGLFATLDTPLPASTQLLMWLSGILRGYWFLVFPGLGGAIAGAVWWSRTPGGTIARDRVAIRLPKFGAIVRSFATARIARILGVLLDSRVPMMEALALTEQSMTNGEYRALLARTRESVTHGDAVSAVFSKSDLINDSLCEAIRNGEQSGRLGTVLLSVADYLDEENETTVKGLASLLEPLIMLGLGLLVGFVAISMFLPLFDLTAAAGGSAPPPPPPGAGA